MYENHLPIYEEEKCEVFALGRNAIYAACQIFGIKPGDEVLTPAFDCDGSLQPFRALGCKLTFFRSDPYTFAVDVDDIKRRITSKTKLLHIINHFGMPQPWDELISLRQGMNIPVLEDNAYSLFSRLHNKLFGTFGDMSIFSLRKNLPLIDGGLLRINNSMYVHKIPHKKFPWFYSTEINGILNIVKTRLGYYKVPKSLRSLVRKLNHATEPPPPLYSESEKGYPDWPLRDQIGRELSCDYLRPMSRLARSQLGKFSPTDYIDIMNKKREHYSWLSEKMNQIKGINILWPVLPEGIIPFCLSFLIESKRDSFFETLRKQYDVMAWPTLPQLVLDQLENFPEVELLGRKLLQLNLPADKVRLPGFSGYLEDFIRDLFALVEAFRPYLPSSKVC